MGALRPPSPGAGIGGQARAQAGRSLVTMSLPQQAEASTQSSKERPQREGTEPLVRSQRPVSRTRTELRALLALAEGMLLGWGQGNS